MVSIVVIKSSTTCTFKDLSRKGTGYLNSRLTLTWVAHPTHSSGSSLFWIPSAKSCWLLGSRRISAVAPTLWNILPLEVKIAPTFLAFQKSLETLICYLAWSPNGACTLGVADRVEKIPTPKLPIVLVFSFPI